MLLFKVWESKAAIAARAAANLHATTKSPQSICYTQAQNKCKEKKTFERKTSTVPRAGSFKRSKHS